MAKAHDDAEAARKAGTSNSSNVTTTGQAYTNEIKNGGTFSVDTWAKVVAEQAATAAKELNKTYTQVTVNSNPQLLSKGQGPNQNQYFALYNYWYISSHDIGPTAGAVRKKLTSNVIASDEQAVKNWWVDTSTMTLAETYRTVNSDASSTDPIYMRINGNTISITANLWIYGDGEYLATANTKGLPSPEQIRYRDLVITGIQDSWSGEYWINGRWVTVNVNASNNNTSHVNSASTDPRFLNVQISNAAGRSNGGVGNPQDWSRSTPGVINMFLCPDKSTTPYTDSQFKGVVGHEFGHTLGMDDAYEVVDRKAWTRKAALYDDVLANDLMRAFNGITSVLDITMAIESFSMRQVQYFPGK